MTLNLLHQPFPFRKIDVCQIEEIKGLQNLIHNSVDQLKCAAIFEQLLSFSDIIIQLDANQNLGNQTDHSDNCPRNPVENEGQSRVAAISVSLEEYEYSFVHSQNDVAEHDRAKQLAAVKVH